MTRTTITSIVIVLALGLGSPARADTYNYWLTVPVKLDRVAPPYTQLALDCRWLNGSKTPGTHPEIAIALDYAGKYDGTVPMPGPIVSSQPGGSYNCYFEPLIGTSYQLPQAMLDGVTGTVPTHESIEPLHLGH
jgi:hypothetical protein